MPIPGGTFDRKEEVQNNVFIEKFNLKIAHNKETPYSELTKYGGFVSNASNMKEIRNIVFSEIIN